MRSGRPSAVNVEVKEQIDQSTRDNRTVSTDETASAMMLSGARMAPEITTEKYFLLC